VRGWGRGCGDGGGGGCFFFGIVCGDRGAGVGVVVGLCGSVMLGCCGVAGHCCGGGVISEWRIRLLTCISGLNR